MNEPQSRPRPVAAALPEHLVKVQCITDLKPWAEIHAQNGDAWEPKAKDERGRPIATPLAIDQVAIIPRDRNFEKMRRNRHLVEIA